MSATSATYSLTLGYAGDCNDPLVVTAYYGATDCGTDKAAWDDSQAFSAVLPGTSNFTVTGLSPESGYFIAFMVTPEGGGEEVWTAAEQLSTASIAVTAPESVFECDPRGVTVTFTFEGGEAVAGAVSHVGPNRVEVAWPSALADVPAGTEISCTVVKTVDGVDYPSNAKSATLVSAE